MVIASVPSMTSPKTTSLPTLRVVAVAAAMLQQRVFVVLHISNRATRKNSQCIESSRCRCRFQHRCDCNASRNLCNNPRSVRVCWCTCLPGIMCYTVYVSRQISGVGMVRICQVCCKQAHHHSTTCKTRHLLKVVGLCNGARDTHTRHSNCNACHSCLL